jgi:hypothetical protein
MPAQDAVTKPAIQVMSILITLHKIFQKSRPRTWRRALVYVALPSIVPISDKEGRILLSYLFHKRRLLSIQLI